VILTLIWRNADHPLLAEATLSVKADGVAVAVAVERGRTRIEIPDATESVQFTLTFVTTIRGSAVEVLRIDQTLQRAPGCTDLFPNFVGHRYTVLTGAERRRRHIPGLHPLILSGPAVFVVRTGLVDVTGVIPEFKAQLDALGPRVGGAPETSQVRILARTDGTLPQFWYVATPHACRGADRTDVLCFFPPSQNHKGIPRSVVEQIQSNSLREFVIADGALMLGAPTHDGGGRGIARLTDHFTPGNVIIARGLERALLASGKKAMIVIPRPANTSHNVAASGVLPGLLTDVHHVITALGDAHPSLVDGDQEHVQTAVARPKFALAAHSRGGLAIWGEPGRPASLGALAAGKDAYTGLLLFECLDVARNLDQLRRSSARVVFIGFDHNTVSGPFGAATSIPALAGRVHRLPVAPAGGAAPEAATLSELADRSPSLAHALTGIATPPQDLFLLKHQLCMWSGDRGGHASEPEAHFMTQALAKSGLD